MEVKGCDQDRGVVCRKPENQSRKKEGGRKRRVSRNSSSPKDRNNILGLIRERGERERKAST